MEWQKTKSRHRKTVRPTDWRIKFIYIYIYTVRERKRGTFMIFTTFLERKISLRYNSETRNYDIILKQEDSNLQNVSNKYLFV